MSSILKALKKLEDQSIEENASLVWPDTVGAKKHETLSKNRKKYVLLLLILIIFLAGAGSYLLKDKIGLDKAGEPPLNVALTQPEENMSSPIYKKDLKIEASDASKPENIEDKVEIKQPPVETDATDEEKIEEKERSSIEEKDVTTAVNTKSDPPPQVQDKPSKPVMKAPSLKQMEDPRIDLQAIAWAPDPKESFVVINNRIVRVGSSVEGITILQIEKDIVSFQEGSSKWQQKFRIR